MKVQKGLSSQCLLRSPFSSLHFAMTETRHQNTGMGDKAKWGKGLLCIICAIKTKKSCSEVQQIEDPHSGDLTVVSF